MKTHTTVIAAALCGLSLWLSNSPAAHAAQTASAQTDSTIVAQAVGGTPYDLYTEGVDPSVGQALASEFDRAAFAVTADQTLSVVVPDQEVRIAEAHFDAYVGEYLGVIDAGPCAGLNFEMGTWGSPNTVVVRIWDDTVYIAFTDHLYWQ